MPRASILHKAKVKGGKVYDKWTGLDSTSLYENRDLAVKTDVETA